MDVAGLERVVAQPFDVGAFFGDGHLSIARLRPARQNFDGAAVVDQHPFGLKRDQPKPLAIVGRAGQIDAPVTQTFQLFDQRILVFFIPRTRR